MSRSTKFIILATFFVLLGTPAGYMALTWRPAEPFRFRYAGRGEIEMCLRSPPGIGDGTRVPMVPIYIEVQSTKNHPIYLGYTRLRAERDVGDVPPVELAWWEQPIPGKGTILLETLVTPEEAGRVERETFEVCYEWVSGTKKDAHDLIDWITEQVDERFHYNIEPPPLETDSTVIGLVKDHHPGPSPTAATPVPE